MKRLPFILEALLMGACYAVVSIGMDALLSGEPLRRSWVSLLVGAVFFGCWMTAMFRWLDRRRRVSKESQSTKAGDV